MLGFGALSELPLSALPALAAIANSALSLTCGYYEVEPEQDLDSYVYQIVEDVQSDYISQVWTDPVAEEATEGYSTVLLLLDQPPQPDFIVQVSTDVEPDAPVDAYGAFLALLDQPAAGDLTQIPSPVITDYEDPEDLESFTSLLFEAGELDASYYVEFPDEDDEEPVSDSFQSGVFDAASFPPGPPAFVELPAGRPRRANYIVRINGKEFTSPTPEGAAEIIRQAKLLAQRSAEIDAKRAAVSIQKVRDLPKSAPVIQGPPEMRREIRAANRHIRETYRQKAIEHELMLLFAERQRAEEEALIVLLM